MHKTQNTSITGAEDTNMSRLLFLVIPKAACGYAIYTQDWEEITFSWQA